MTAAVRPGYGASCGGFTRRRRPGCQLPTGWKALPGVSQQRLRGRSMGAPGAGSVFDSPGLADDIGVSRPPRNPPVSTNPDVRLLRVVPWADLFATWWRVADHHPVGDPMRQSCYDVVVERGA